MLLLPLFATGGAMTSGSVPADAGPCDSPIAAWTQQGSMAMASGSAGGFRQQFAQQGMGGSTGDVFNSLFANWNRDTLITTPEARSMISSQHWVQQNPPSRGCSHLFLLQSLRITSSIL